MDTTQYSPGRLRRELRMIFVALVVMVAGVKIPGALAGETPANLSDNAILDQEDFDAETREKVMGKTFLGLLNGG